MADVGVLAHHRPLLRRQLAGLEQDVVRRADLADVVHRRGLQQQFLFLRRHSHARGDQVRVVGHAQDMGAGFWIPVFGRTGQPEDRVALALDDLAGRLAHFLGQP